MEAKLRRFTITEPMHIAMFKDKQCASKFYRAPHLKGITMGELMQSIFTIYTDGKEYVIEYDSYDYLKNEKENITKMLRYYGYEGKIKNLNKVISNYRRITERNSELKIENKKR